LGFLKKSFINLTSLEVPELESGDGLLAGRVPRQHRAPRGKKQEHMSLLVSPPLTKPPGFSHGAHPNDLIQPYSPPKVPISKYRSRIKFLSHHRLLQRHLHTHVYCSTIHIAKLWKQPRCPTTDEWIKKMWYLYRMEFCAAMKKNKMLSFASEWMELENI
jgi:hypothetical protein